MRKILHIKLLVLTSAIIGAAAILPCRQAEAGGFIDLNFENVPTIIGMGAGTMPDYSGSNDYTYGIAPFFRYTLKGQERYVQLLANELTFNVLDNDMFRFGPLLSYKFGRSDSLDDTVVKRMKKIDDTIEAGAFADVVWSLSSDERQRFIVGAKLYQDMGNVSQGFRTNISARYWHPVAKPVDLNVSAGFLYGNDKYSNTYYGVNADNVGTSGLSFFNAGGGVNEYYAVVGANAYLSKNWLVGVGVRGSVLAGDPAKSPIVDPRGSATQWIGGVGLGYIIW